MALKDAPKCEALSKRTRQPCQAPAMANGRCRFHGGKSPVSVASPHFKHGNRQRTRYDQFFDGLGMTEAAEAALSDADLYSSDDALCLLQTRVFALLEHGLGIEWARALSQTWAQFKTATRKAHLLYLRHALPNRLDHLFDLLDALPDGCRAIILLPVYAHLDIDLLDESGHLRIPQDNPQNYAAFKAKCRELAATVMPFFVVSSLVRLLLHELFHMADLSSINEMQERARRLAHRLAAVPQRSAPVAPSEPASDFWHSHIEQLPAQTAHYYQLYLYFCDAVVRPLLDASLASSVFPIQERSPACQHSQP